MDTLFKVRVGEEVSSYVLEESFNNFSIVPLFNEAGNLALVHLGDGTAL